MPWQSSATDSDEALGVFLTVMPASSAYFTSMLSTPTPPRMMSLSLPPFASSMWLARTLVLERTTTASNSAQRSAQLIRLIELLDNFVTCFAQLRHSGLVHSIGNENAHDKLSLFSVVMGFLCQTRRDRFAAPYEVAGNSDSIGGCGRREIFRQDKVWKAKEYFVYFSFFKPKDWRKDPPSVVGD